MNSYNTLNVLYIENDQQFRKKTADTIRQNGFNVFETDNNIEANEIFCQRHIDIVIANLPIPNEDGLDLIRTIRKKEILTPVLITTSITDEKILLEAIKLDITYCLVKPFNNIELLKSLQIATKKVHNCNPISFTDFHDGFSYDPINKMVLHPDKETIQLTKKEYLLLELLLSNKQHIISYETIEEVVWGSAIMSMDALRTLVHSLRKKTYPHLLDNTNGTGYKIDL